MLALRLIGRASIAMDAAQGIANSGFSDDICRHPTDECAAYRVNSSTEPINPVLRPPQAVFRDPLASLGISKTDALSASPA